MSEPYDYEVIARMRTEGDVVVQAEEWRDTNGHRTHIAIAVDNEVTRESVTVLIGSDDEARALKNLFAQVERRLK